MAGGVDHAEAAGRGRSGGPGFLEEVEAFAVEGHGAARVDEGEFGAELLGVALVSFDVAGAGRGLGLGSIMGWLGGAGADIGFRGDCSAASNQKDLVCGYGRDRHGGCLVDSCVG